VLFQRIFAIKNAVLQLAFLALQRKTRFLNLQMEGCEKLAFFNF